MDEMIEALEISKDQYCFGDPKLWEAIANIDVGDSRLDAYTEAKCSHWDRQLEDIKSGKCKFVSMTTMDEFLAYAKEQGIDMDSIE